MDISEDSVLYLEVDDVTRRMVEHSSVPLEYHYKLFNDWDGICIATFIDDMIKKGKKRIVFQCEAGISRSVGACQAFLEFHYGQEVVNKFIQQHPFGNDMVIDKTVNAMQYLEEWAIKKEAEKKARQEENICDVCNGIIHEHPDYWRPVDNVCFNCQND